MTGYPIRLQGNNGVSYGALLDKMRYAEHILIYLVFRIWLYQEVCYFKALNDRHDFKFYLTHTQHTHPRTGMPWYFLIHAKAKYSIKQIYHNEE